MADLDKTPTAIDAMASVHLIHRARGTCFSCPADCLGYLDLLCTFAAHYESAVHAYALMANHVHVLVTSAKPEGGTELIRAVRERHWRRDAIWNEGLETRLVYARRYLLACMRYIELNPVRAGIVQQAAEYRWSSYRANALGYVDPIVKPHPLYYALGRSPEARRAAYARLVRRGSARPDIASP
jgi:putative transposase